MSNSLILPFLLLALLQPAIVHAEDAEAVKVECPACKGTGTCAGEGCIAGKTPCPNTCLKKEVGEWHKMKVAGHSDDELWITMPDGHSWSQAHIGELVVDDKGVSVNKGKCPTCDGATKVTCASCKGSAICAACAGAKTVSKEAKKEWLAQVKKEGAAKTALDQLKATEKKAGAAKGALADVARNYMKLAAKYPDTVAGQQAKSEAERLAKDLEQK